MKKKKGFRTDWFIRLHGEAFHFSMALALCLPCCHGWYYLGIDQTFECHNFSPSWLRSTASFSAESRRLTLEVDQTDDILTRTLKLFFVAGFDGLLVPRIGLLWQQHRLLHDQLFYRYAYDFHQVFRASSCALCSALRDSKLLDAKKSPSPLLFVGVYSAASNSAKRLAIRASWAKVFGVYGEVKFFLGRPAENATRVKAEIQKYQDLVLLDVPEGYQWNSLKGLRFLEWCSSNVLAEFLVKVDDDVYLRPLPLITLLRQRPPVGHLALVD